MIVPVAMGSDESYVELFIEGRNRDIKSVYIFRIPITVVDMIYSRFNQLCTFFLGIWEATRIIRNSTAVMNFIQKASRPTFMARETQAL